MLKTRPPYSPEFRRQMVESVRARWSPEDLARCPADWQPGRPGPQAGGPPGGGSPRLDDSRARRTCPAVARCAPVPCGARHLLKSRGLVRPGVRDAPVRVSRFMCTNVEPRGLPDQAVFLIGREAALTTT